MRLVWLDWRGRETSAGGQTSGDAFAVDAAGKMDSRKVARWETVCLCAAVAVAWLLAGANLGEPALWHDELIHVYVAKSVASGDLPQLPSGVPYYNGTIFNVLLAGVIALFGDGEATVRSPAVFLSGVNVLLAWWVLRPLLGAPAAVVAAFGMALSPWTVAWAREARFYTMQQGAYLLLIGAFWRGMQAAGRRRQIAWTLVAACAYAVGLLCSFHSGLFLSGIGIFAAAMFAVAFAQRDAASRKRWIAAIALIGIATLASFGYFAGFMNPLDRETVLERGGLGGEMIDPERQERQYYVNWLRRNHSEGFYVLALIGFGAMAWRERRRGLLVAAAFWVPVLLLTYFIGYRQPRFMFFAFPFYVAAFSYGGFVLAQWLRRPKRTWWAMAAAAVVLVFAGRLGVSAARLVDDSFEAASGADTTLARRHPQWKTPAAYVRAHLKPEDAVLTTTYLPVLYYVGRVDNWYPTRFLWWEVDESGQDDLKDVPDLARFLAAHPRGYYIAEWWRFNRHPLCHPDAAFVEMHMQRVHEASTEDVFVFRWTPETVGDLRRWLAAGETQHE